MMNNAEIGKAMVIKLDPVLPECKKSSNERTYSEQT